jgi:hypothetical protein
LHPHRLDAEENSGQGGGRVVNEKPHQHRAGAGFDEAAERVAAEIRRLDDLADGVRRKVRDIQWTGRSAE